jgi:hypothetical protein
VCSGALLFCCDKNVACGSKLTMVNGCVQVSAKWSRDGELAVLGLHASMTDYAMGPSVVPASPRLVALRQSTSSTNVLLSSSMQEETQDNNPQAPHFKGNHISCAPSQTVCKSHMQNGVFLSVVSLANHNRYYSLGLDTSRHS